MLYSSSSIRIMRTPSLVGNYNGGPFEADEGLDARCRCEYLLLLFGENNMVLHLFMFDIMEILIKLKVEKIKKQ